MHEPDEIALFYDRCSALMRELLEELATAPGRPRPFAQIEDALGWPRRRIASVLGGAFRLRTIEFGGRRPYRFHPAETSASGRWELWMDRGQASAVRAARRESGGAARGRHRREAMSAATGNRPSRCVCG